MKTHLNILCISYYISVGFLSETHQVRLLYFISTFIIYLTAKLMNMLLLGFLPRILCSNLLSTSSSCAKFKRFELPYFCMLQLYYCFVNNLSSRLLVSRHGSQIFYLMFIKARAGLIHNCMMSSIFICIFILFKYNLSFSSFSTELFNLAWPYSRHGYMLEYMQLDVSSWLLRNILKKMTSRKFELSPRIHSS